jgi:hypothetical protein
MMAGSETHESERLVTASATATAPESRAKSARGKE